VRWESGGVVRKRAGNEVESFGGMLLGFILGDKGSEGFVESVECIDVGHHAVGSMNDGEMICEEFLCETADLVQRAFVV